MTFLLLLLFSAPAYSGDLTLPSGLEFREPFLIGKMQAGVQSPALQSSRGSCRAVLLSEKPAGSVERAARFQGARVEGTFHKVLVAERVSLTHGRQELQVECMVRLRDKTPLTEQEFLGLMLELGLRIKR